MCDGSTYSRTTYSNLYGVVGDAFGEGDGSTTFHVPDMRGRFLRGVDGTAGRDPDSSSRTAMNTNGNTGNNVGSVQDDAFQGHKHSISPSQLDSTVSASDNGRIANGGSVSHVANAGVGNPTSDGTNGTPRTSSETRPINAYVNFIIKI